MLQLWKVWPYGKVLYSDSEKRASGGFCTSSYHGKGLKAHYWPLPIIQVVVNKTVMTALVDTRCTTTLINSRLLIRCGIVKAVDGRDIKCKGAWQMECK